MVDQAVTQLFSPQLGGISHKLIAVKHGTFFHVPLGMNCNNFGVITGKNSARLTFFIFIFSGCYPPVLAESQQDFLCECQNWPRCGSSIRQSCGTWVGLGQRNWKYTQYTEPEEAHIQYVAQIFIKIILLSDHPIRVCIYCCIMRQMAYFIKITNNLHITPSKH